MSQHTPAEWARSAACNMLQAQCSQERAHRQNHRSKSVHGETVDLNVALYQEVAQAMKRKVANSHRLIAMLQKRADSIENSIKLTCSSLALLEKGLFDKEAPLQFCVWRLEQRERRPLTEQVRDPVETALEEEKAAIMETQQRLKSNIQRTKVAIDHLHQALEDCRRDIQCKVQALQVDETCLGSTQCSLNRVVQKTPPHSGRRPLSASTNFRSHQVALSESSRNEVVRQRQAEAACEEFACREEGARALREENARLERHCQQKAADFRARTERRLQERVQDNQKMKRMLEAELRETQARIRETKHTMHETRHQIKALDEPMDVTAACSSWRKQRACNEGINDPVTTALQKHRYGIHAVHQELVENHQSERSNLADLQQRRDHLKNDLKGKTAALHIDLNCLTHEVAHLNGRPMTAINKIKAGYLKKSERGWVPGAVAFSAR